MFYLVIELYNVVYFFLMSFNDQIKIYLAAKKLNVCILL